MQKEQIDELKRKDLRQYLEKRGHEFKNHHTLCPFHADREPSLFVKQENEHWLWYCHSCQIGGSIIDYVKKADGLDNREAIEKLVAEFGMESESKKEVARYAYVDEIGETLYNIIRYEPKAFIADRKMDGIPRVPYHLDYFVDHEQVWLVEGEKDADTLLSLGLLGTTMPFGVKNWRKENARFFEGKDVVVCLDKGRLEEARQRAIDLLNAGARAVKVVDLEGLVPEEDITDWIKKNDVKTKQPLLDMVREIPVFIPESQLGEEDLSMSEMVKEYVDAAMGWFKIDEVYRYIGASDRNDKKNVSKALSRMVDEGILARHRRANGLYRKPDNQREVMDWLNANICPIDIKLPLEVDHYFATYPKNILVFAGTPDAGKTAYFLEFIKQNMEFLDIHYFNSEMSNEELKLRLKAHEDIELEDWKFEAVSRVSEFADVIEPDGVNVIDYMELGDEIHKVGLFMRELHDKLDNGIALVGIQKPYGRELGYGKELALQIPRLYISLEYHKRNNISSARILKCKNRLTNYSMIGKILYYKIYGGWKIEPHGLWHYYGDDPLDEVIFGEKKKTYS